MQQRVGQVCGTIAVLHALGNNTETLGIEPTSIMGKFIDRCKDMNPEERGKALALDEDIKRVHYSGVEKNETGVGLLTNHHYVCFVHCGGMLYELDGSCPTRKPICHGPTNPDKLLEDAAKVIRDTFINKDKTDSISYVVLTLSPNKKD